MATTTLTHQRKSLIVIFAMLLLLPIYYLPVWWVSLTAPNYPVESFPSGVKIHFHMNGVFNGCAAVDNSEIHEDERLDCVHEMDTINHYVGMYPIAAGGPLENSFAIFLMSLVGVMLLGYIVEDPKKRMMVMAGGFAILAIWMTVVMYSSNGLNFHNSGYINGRVATLGQEGDSAEKDLTAGEALIERMKASLAASGVDVEHAAEMGQKELDLKFLKESFLASQKRLTIEGSEWKGSGIQLLSWHYRASLGRYFNDPAKIDPMVNSMTTAANVVYGAILVIMLVLIFGARKSNGLLHWMLLLVPIGLPLFFIVGYSSWLGWFGHNMNEMGAFTLKPFMPTVFGQGKVAQFTTNSYPHIAFYMMLLFAGLLAFVAISTRKQIMLENAKDSED
jgi:hypothetical protein